MKAILMLEDGKSFSGCALSGPQEEIGELILNTAVVGYQEMVTDPANAGKILVLTYPLIGNYGCAQKFDESKKVWLAGLIIKENSAIFSNWQGQESFIHFAKRHNLLVMSAVDTRTLAVHLRQKGQMLGMISTRCFIAKELSAKIENFSQHKKESLLADISVNKPTLLGSKKAKRKIAVLDLGITKSIIRQIEKLGLSLTLLPYNTPAQDILRLKPHGLIISGGPEEDPGLEVVVDNIRQLVGKIPILGIATGHQILAVAVGAKISKLKLGHRGVNYPVHNPASYKCEITVQNHSQVVESASLAAIKNVQITASNLNDRTIEEMESKKLKLLGVQYNPVSPGFAEVHEIFKRFLKILGRS